MSEDPYVESDLSFLFTNETDALLNEPYTLNEKKIYPISYGFGFHSFEDMELQDSYAF